MSDMSRFSLWDACHAAGAQLCCVNGAARCQARVSVHGARQAASSLHDSADIATILDNTPAKPMWTSVFMLKSSGFFIGCRSGPSPTINGGTVS